MVDITRDETLRRYKPLKGTRRSCVWFSMLTFFAFAVAVSAEVDTGATSSANYRWSDEMAAEMKEAHAYGRDALKALLYINSGLILALVGLVQLSNRKIDVSKALVRFGFGAGAAAVASFSFFATFFLYVRVLKGRATQGEEIAHPLLAALSVGLVLASLLSSGLGVRALVNGLEGDIQVDAELAKGGHGHAEVQESE